MALPEETSTLKQSSVTTFNIWVLDASYVTSFQTKSCATLFENLCSIPRRLFLRVCAKQLAKKDNTT